MKGRNLSTWGVILALIIVQGRAASQQLEARAWVDSASFVVGDPIRVHVQVDHPAGTTLTALPGDSLGLTVLEPLTLKPEQDSGSSGYLVVSAYDSGSAIFPSIAFLATKGGSTSPDTVLTNPVLLNISLVDVDTSDEIKDLKPPLTIPLTFADVALWTGIVLALLALAYGVYRFWKKRQEKKTELPAYTPPPKAAHIIALEELGRLKDERLWQKGEVKEYYSRLTDIVRRYFEQRYGFMALEQTTDEILSELRRHPTAEEVWSETGDVLRRADMVKFARHMPSMSDHEKAMESARNIVERTRVKEPSFPASQGKENEPHAVV